MSDHKTLDEDKTSKNKTTLPDERCITTRHSILLGDTTLKYEATAGLMHISNEKGSPIAAIFYVAYTLEQQTPHQRPITFCFNGGPGSSAVWLHLGAFGPKRIQMIDLKTPQPNLSALVDNPHTLLDCSDLVFIDPVGTGFSVSGEEGKDEDFYNIDGDSESLSAFIERYLNINHRWASPKFLAGESYGTTRSGAMVKYLQAKGIVFNGLLMISLAMNFQTFHFDPGNDLPYLMFLPTYAATAWYHGRLDDDIAPDLDTLLSEVRQWTMDIYAPALLRGSGISPEHKAHVAQDLARYTSMDATEIEQLNLRIADMRFSKSVLNRHGYTVGRMDGRYIGLDVDQDHRRTQRDPSIDAPWGPYTGCINDYLRRTLTFEHDRPYQTFNMKANRAWSWERKDRLCYPDTSDDLRQAMVANPHLAVLFANGIYDMATPFFAAEYTADHLELPPEIRQNLRLTYYPAGHMMYFHAEAHAKLKADIYALYQESMAPFALQES